MNPPDDRNGNSVSGRSLADPQSTVLQRYGQRHGDDCTPPVDEGDNVIDFARGNGVPAEALIVMAKYWQPGRVKTRLAAKIGFEAAASLHELFTRRLAQTLSRASDCRQVRVSPDDCCRQMANAISPNWSVRAQGDGDLGQRMWRGFCDCFAAGAGRVVMIGADLPTLCQADIQVAFEHLRTCDLVLGPASDGGYYLIGLRHAANFDRMILLFQTIPWSTSSVLRDTLSIAARAGLSVEQLEEREDVDHWTDLVRLVQRLERSDSTDDTELATGIRATLRHACFLD